MANTAKTRTRKTTSTPATAPADLSALVASGAVTIEVIDVTTAQLDPNVRTEATYTAEFVESIKAEGVREPVYARRGDDGTVYVWDGQRRTLAAKEAGTATMLGIFGLTPSTVKDSARILDQLRTFNRSDLNQADRLAAYEQLALDGISDTVIGRAAGESRDTIKKSVMAAKSTAAKQVAKDFGQVSLDKLLAIAEFEDDENAVDRITWADDDDLAYVAQELRDERTAREVEAKLVAHYTEQGYQVFTDYSSSFKRVDLLTDAADDADERSALTAETHTECAGRAVILTVYGEDDYRVTEVCATPDAHRPYYRSSMSVKVDHRTPVEGETDEQRAEREALADAEATAKKAERARVIANNKAWRTAIKVRRDWIASFLARKTLPKNAAVFVAQSVTTHAQALTDYQAGSHVGAFLGQEASHYGRADAAKIAEGTPTKAGHVTLAVMLSAREARAEDVQGWRSVSPVIASYLLALEGWGYKLSAVERIAAGYPEATDTEQDTDAEKAAADVTESGTPRRLPSRTRPKVPPLSAATTPSPRRRITGLS
ncbi:ParB/RepB/Spo0J family partition protein [Leifsonia aquatica]|uniref:ParB/RepB/Spo0J family partition protein n=1 Tax=Leifsonia aquatica TaxID=144185 RepID=UPI003823E21F